MKPSPSRRVLLVEDSINDTFLIVRELQQAGLDVEFERVETAGYMKSALRERSWDLIICDCCLPQFDGLKALALYHQERLDIPFIMVSGKMGEDHALEMIRAGAHDYVPKDNLARLASAVLRELRAAEERRTLMEAAAGSVLADTKPVPAGSNSRALLAGSADSEPGKQKYDPASN
ncbi:MAG: response regulator [Bryobacteraceae bacterium]